VESEPFGPASRGVRDPLTAGVGSLPMPLVLVVEDDRKMRKYLQYALADAQFRVVEAETGSEALMHAAGHNPDLVLLDYGLPDLDGIRVTTRLRERTAAPILMISARDEEDDKIAALDAGANDYLTKPFGTGELLARLRVWLRHSQLATADPHASSIEVGELKIDHDLRLVFRRGSEVRLTPTQYKLFAVPMRHAGRVLTHEELLHTVWGPGYIKETQYLRVYMGQLRHKFEEDPARPRYIVTEPGVGYRLRVP
jgi:two-component system, OmpR family, KDP operon response regulator KdpE